ncbi:MAG: SAM-dependent methyltransferase, partial [Solirubrobacteraceae bacterium]
WITADIRDHAFDRRFDLWHDRAVFHFMVSDADRASYVQTLERSLEPRGHVIIATFGPDGPTRCSGLPVHRYGADELVRALPADLELADAALAEHRTPSGNSQQFLHAHLVRRPA